MFALIDTAQSFLFPESVTCPDNVTRMQRRVGFVEWYEKETGRTFQGVNPIARFTHKKIVESVPAEKTPNVESLRFDSVFVSELGFAVHPHIATRYAHMVAEKTRIEDEKKRKKNAKAKDEKPLRANKAIKSREESDRIILSEQYTRVLHESGKPLTSGQFKRATWIQRARNAAGDNYTQKAIAGKKGGKAMAGKVFNAPKTRVHQIRELPIGKRNPLSLFWHCLQSATLDKSERIQVSYKFPKWIQEFTLQKLNDSEPLRMWLYAKSKRRESIEHRAKRVVPSHDINACGVDQNAKLRKRKTAPSQDTRVNMDIPVSFSDLNDMDAGQSRREKERNVKTTYVTRKSDSGIRFESRVVDRSKPVSRPAKTRTVITQTERAKRTLTLTAYKG